MSVDVIIVIQILDNTVQSFVLSVINIQILDTELAEICVHIRLAASLTLSKFWISFTILDFVSYNYPKFGYCTARSFTKTFFFVSVLSKQFASLSKFWMEWNPHVYFIQIHMATLIKWKFSKNNGLCLVCSPCRALGHT